MRTADVIRIWLVVTAFVLPGIATAQPRETAGVITELKLGQGKAEIRAAGGAWRPAAPLQALRAGDEVRATQDATVVVLLSGGHGTVKVDAQRSPFVIASSVDGSQVDRARTLVTASLKFLTSGPKEPPKAVLATRSIASLPPEILTPRNGPVLPGALAFEWVGSRSARYAVRLVAPSGVVLERPGVVGPRLDYPPGAPALQPGVRYRLEIIAVDQPASATTFEIVDAARAQTVQADLRELERALGPGVSASSRAVARAGYLPDGGFFHDARLTVLGALARDPGEPVLHTLLGTLYAQTGLTQPAAEAFDEARFLMTRGK